MGNSPAHPSHILFSHRLDVRLQMAKAGLPLPLHFGLVQRQQIPSLIDMSERDDQKTRLAGGHREARLWRPS